MIFSKLLKNKKERYTFENIYNSALLYEKRNRDLDEIIDLMTHIIQRLPDEQESESEEEEN